jgi:hypothetical protein
VTFHLPGRSARIRVHGRQIPQSSLHGLDTFGERGAVLEYCRHTCQITLWFHKIRT